MTSHQPIRARDVARGFMQGAVALGALGVLAFGAQNNGGHRSRRTGRRGAAYEADLGEPPPVSDEQRLVEPLGPRVPWGFVEQLDGEYGAQAVELTRQIILLGRQAGCDIVLDDDRASRYHAMMLWDRGCGYIQDNGSMNGTNLNGQRAVGPVPLRHGDIIEILDLRYRFLYSEQTGLNVMEAQPTEHIASASPPPAYDLVRQANVSIRLTALTGPEPGRSWPIGNTPMLIGRGTESVVMLPHASVSRRHAQLASQPNGIYIQDVGSSNGTSVNGEPLTQPRRLQHNDHIQVGDVLLVLSIEPLDAGQSPAPPSVGQGAWNPPAAPPAAGWGPAPGQGARSPAGNPAGGPPPAWSGPGAGGQQNQPPPGRASQPNTPPNQPAVQGWGPAAGPANQPQGWPGSPPAPQGAGWSAQPPPTQGPSAFPNGQSVNRPPSPAGPPPQGWSASQGGPPQPGGPQQPNWPANQGGSPQPGGSPQQGGWAQSPGVPQAQPPAQGGPPPGAASQPQGQPPQGWPGPNPANQPQGQPPQGWPGPNPANQPQGQPPQGWPAPNPATQQGQPPQGWPAPHPANPQRPPPQGWPADNGQDANGDQRGGVPRYQPPRQGNS